MKTLTTITKAPAIIYDPVTKTEIEDGIKELTNDIDAIHVKAKILISKCIASRQAAPEEEKAYWRAKSRIVDHVRKNLRTSKIKLDR